jgi:hypothetical protein
MRTTSIRALTKSAAAGYIVGGVASSFHRDLDGEAILPEAVEEAIPDFMAMRGPDGIQGGPLRLHHDFWTRFLRQAIESLQLPVAEQMRMVAAISLPLGRVTRMWLDEQGTTYWEGELSQKNPVSVIIWDMLREGLIHLGVSLGGKILETASGGRDRLGRPCTLITKIRVDELSITDNPALRLTQEEDTGAYITALAKSVRSSLQRSRKFMTDQQKIEQFLNKALKKAGSAFDASEAMRQGNAAWDSPSDSGTKTGMGDRGVGEPKSLRPRGKGKIRMNDSTTTTGMGGKSKASPRPRATGNEPKTDVYGYTVGQLVRELGKCASMSKADLSGADTLSTLTNGAYGLATLSDQPPEALINLVRFLQYFSQFAQELPHMDDFRARGTMEAMGRDLTKALEEFQEKMPKELMAQTFRPPSAAGISGLDIVFPQQYVIYS